MIHYSLSCSQAHVFDGWFASSAGFDAQVKRGLVECPTCGDVAVIRALMAPSVSKKGNARRPEAKAEAMAVSVPASAGERMTDQVRSVLQKMRAEVERRCDYVGTDFAEEARRIHTGESDRRGIYGEASAEQAEALAEDGIAVSQIPWVKRADG